MIIGLRAGHSPNAKGAVGYIDEYNQMIQFYGVLKELLEKHGHKIIDCNSNANSPNAELSEGTNKANAQYLDLFISLHMNSGGGTGVEMWTFGSESRANIIAQALCKNLSKGLNIPNRGLKYNNNYYEMRYIKAPNIISELCFVDSKYDTDAYNSKSWNELVYMYANAIDYTIPFNPSSNEEKPPAKNGLYYVVSDYLPRDSNNYTNMEDINLIFEGIRYYIRQNDKGIWIETKYLDYEKCLEIKDKLQKKNLFWNIYED